MKKILLAVLLLALVVAVSYVKTWREHQRGQEFYDRGRSESIEALDEYQKETDSLKTALTETRLATADSLTKKEIAHRVEVDSLQNLVDEQSQAIEKLSAQASSPTTASQEASARKPLSKHEQIITYYKKRYAALPKDLSNYEKRIALSEIREETSQRFSISLKELSEIRKKYKLAY